MLIDSKLIFSNDQVVCNSGSEASDYEIDFGVASANMGAGTPLKAVFIVTTTFATCTSILFSVQAATDGSTYANIVASGAIAVATLVAGYRLELFLPREHGRYLQAYYTLEGSNATAGKVVAYLDMA